MNENPLSDSPGWRSRGYLPHFDQPDLLQSITIRLYDAVPKHLIENWKTKLFWTEKISPNDPRRAALRKQIGKYEDDGHGACWLEDDRIAAMVESSLLKFDESRYRLLAWCVMPNHVHSIIEIWDDFPLNKVLHSWKSYTAHEANKVLNRSGEFWFKEYYDRYMRDAEHFSDTVEYIEQNPVTAQLVTKKEQWKWSSFRLRCG
jgi:putative transposase